MIFVTADVERLIKARGAASVRDYKVLIAPFAAENIGEHVLVRNNGNAVIRIIRRHDCSGAAVHNGSLERWEIEGPELTFTSVDRGSVEALFGRRECRLRLHEPTNLACGLKNLNSRSA